jgi:predicted N-acetyltransferase YhbS
MNLKISSKTRISIREERPEDIPAIRRINEQAFGQPAEAKIVAAFWI